MNQIMTLGFSILPSPYLGKYYFCSQVKDDPQFIQAITPFLAEKFSIPHQTFYPVYAKTVYEFLEKSNPNGN